MKYDFDWSVLAPHGHALAVGFARTLGLTACVILAGTPLGICLGVGVSKLPSPIRQVMDVMLAVVRSVPPLICVLLGYYIAPLLGIGFQLSPFSTAALVLAIYLAAFTADVVRGAIEQVPTGYIDAATAVGLSRIAVSWRIELPVALRSVMPTLWLLWIGMMKHTSLASIIGVYELTHTGSLIIGSTFRSVETYCVIALLYALTILPLYAVARHFERRIRTTSSLSL